MDQNDVLRLKTLVQEMKAIVDKYEQPSTPGPVEPPAKAITHVILESLSDKPQEYVPFTFGQVFAVGDFKLDSGMAGGFDNGDTIPLQVDVKALHADGSVRHAIISGIGGALFGKEQRKMDLIPAKAGKGQPVTPSKMPNGSVKLKLDGVEYSTNAGLLSNPMQWLLGAEVGELRARVKLTDKNGKEHPHLTVRVGFRAYRSKHVRLEIVVENVWAYEPNPQNFTYDVVIEIDGKKVYEQKALIHFHHARWRKVFWIGQEPQIHIRRDAAYIMQSGAVDTYSLSELPTEKVLNDYFKELDDPKKFGMMRVGLAHTYMPATGGRRDIGMLPGWDVAWLLSQDRRAQLVAEKTAELAGSWPVHYRDKNTDRPISVVDYPYMTLLSNASARNKVTKADERFPSVPADDLKAVPHTYENSHNPSLGYFSYLMKGDYYDLEELQFMAQYAVSWTNPEYRKADQGLIYKTQVRGQAWSMRSLFEAAYITPDGDPLKKQFVRFVENNLAYYNSTFTDNPKANKLGALNNDGAYAYPKSGPDSWTGISTWQDSFVTWAFAQGGRMGFTEAERFAKWKIKFVIGRYIGDGVFMPAAVGADDSGVWLIRPKNGAPEFETFHEAYEMTVGPEIAKLKTADEVAKALKIPVGSMKGYASTDHGYPSNDQPALAHAARLSDEGKIAWDKFMNRSQIPKYDVSQIYNVVPAIYPRAK